MKKLTIPGRFQFLWDSNASRNFDVILCDCIGRAGSLSKTRTHGNAQKREQYKSGKRKKTIETARGTILDDYLCVHGSRWRLMPRMMRGVDQRTINTTALGSKVSAPIGIAPTAMQRMANPEGECATARGGPPLFLQDWWLGMLLLSATVFHNFHRPRTI